jgi:hypothetical protein
MSGKNCVAHFENEFFSLQHSETDYSIVLAPNDVLNFNLCKPLINQCIVDDSAMVSRTTEGICTPLSKGDSVQATIHNDNLMIRQTTTAKCAADRTKNMTFTL